MLLWPSRRNWERRTGGGGGVLADGLSRLQLLMQLLGQLRLLLQLLCQGVALIQALQHRQVHGLRLHRNPIFVTLRAKMRHCRGLCCKLGAGYHDHIHGRQTVAALLILCSVS